MVSFEVFDTIDEAVEATYTRRDMREAMKTALEKKGVWDRCHGSRGKFSAGMYQINPNLYTIFWVRCDGSVAAKWVTGTSGCPSTYIPDLELQLIRGHC